MCLHFFSLKYYLFNYHDLIHPEAEYIPYNPEFLKWTPPPLNLEAFIIADRDLSQKKKKSWSVSPELSHLDLHC